MDFEPIPRSSARAHGLGRKDPFLSGQPFKSDRLAWVGAAGP
jgi:hypothetical protein